MVKWGGGGGIMRCKILYNSLCDAFGVATVKVMVFNHITV